MNESETRAEYIDPKLKGGQAPNPPAGRLHPHPVAHERQNIRYTRFSLARAKVERIKLSALKPR